MGFDFTKVRGRRGRKRRLWAGLLRSQLALGLEVAVCALRHGGMLILRQEGNVIRMRRVRARPEPTGPRYEGECWNEAAPMPGDWRDTGQNNS